MINKKVEIKLKGVEMPLWFNNYAVFELQKMYGVSNADIMSKLKERLEDNFLLVISDLVKIGIKGQYLATDERKPSYFDSINLFLAEENEEHLMLIWSDLWTIFSEHMGLNLPVKEEEVKKKATPKPKKATR